jgi:hypothetical protein
MPKITEEPLTAIQVRLFEADLAALKRLYGQDVGVNAAIRTIVRVFLRQVDAKANATIDSQEAQSLAEEIPDNVLEALIGETS